MDLEPVHEDPKPGDIRQSRADIIKAKKILGYRPEIKLEEGIKSLIKHK
jgi:nucleoside-diphosphate-sugar epimerase